MHNSNLLLCQSFSYFWVILLSEKTIPTTPPASPAHLFHPLLHSFQPFSPPLTLSSNLSSNCLHILLHNHLLLSLQKRAGNFRKILISKHYCKLIIILYWNKIGDNMNDVLRREWFSNILELVALLLFWSHNNSLCQHPTPLLNKSFE